MVLIALSILQEPVTVARDGRATMPILSGSVPDAAAELGHYLSRISGATFGLTESRRNLNGIHVGVAEDFPWLGLRLGPQSFMIRSDGESLYIVGGGPAGVRHAVGSFLQELGCRWFFPGKVWEVIPKRDLIRGNWNEQQAPAFPDQRNIWYGFGAFPSCQQEYGEWCRHNRMGHSIPISIGHTWYGLDPKADFQAHPEWFALVQGKRKSSKPCFSEPAVLERAIQSALAHAGDGMISLSPPDGLGYCECDRCFSVFQGGKPYAAHGSTFAKRPDGTVVNATSETLFSFVNKVAAAVAEKQPGRLVGCYAYSAYSHPPYFRLNPNVYVQTTTAYRRTDLTLEEELQAFGKVASRIGIREYYSVYQWDWDYPQNPAKVKPERLQKDLRLFRENHVTAVNAEASNNWGPRGLGYYVASRLMWDTEADVRAIVQDFYENAFGPAAGPMRRYYERWYGSAGLEGAPKGELDDRAKPKFDNEALKGSFRDLDEAARLAKADPGVSARVDQLRMYWHYLFLRHKLDEAKDAKAIVEAVREETVFGGRLASTNLIHSRALLGKAFERRFKAQMNLLAKEPRVREWRKVGTPPTAAEVAEFWEGDRKDLGL